MLFDLSSNTDSDISVVLGLDTVLLSRWSDTVHSRTCNW